MSDRLDVIALRGLSAVGSHGVYDFERHGSQVFTADLKLYVDSRKAAQTDDVAYTVDYSQLAERAVEILSGKPVYLIETLASNLADMALSFPLVQRVEVTVHKPMAPVRHQFEDVSVRVSRSRAEVGSEAAVPPATERVSRNNAPKIATHALTAPVISTERPVAEGPTSEVAEAPLSERTEAVPPVLEEVEGTRAVSGEDTAKALGDVVAAGPASGRPEHVSLPPGFPSRRELARKEAEPKSPFPSRRSVRQDEILGTEREVRVVSAEEAKASRGVLAGPLLIPRSFDEGASVYRMVLSLGSNKGDSLKTLAGAVEALSNTPGIQIEQVSPVVRTLPVLEPGALPQDDFQNIAVVGRTVLPPPVLLQVINKIEADFGRVRGRRWAARTLDIDIIDMDGMRVNSRELVLPHPRAHERAFVLYPWSLIAPQDELRGYGPIRDLLVDAPDMSGLLTVRETWLGEDGNVEPGEERKLRERPETPRLTDSPDLESVTVRGEQLHLVPIEFDPIFSKLMASEARAERQAEIRAAAEARAAQAKPAAEAKPQPKLEVEPDPSQAVRDKNHDKGRSRLPDWRAAATTRTRKVVDDGTEESASGAVPAVTGSIATGRRVTIRPTPTGSFPVTGSTGQSGS